MRINWRKFADRFLTWLSPLYKKPPQLADIINDARITWKQSLNNFNFVTDANLVDYTIHHIKASERRYMALLAQARKEGVTAWTGYLPCPAADTKKPGDPEYGRQAVNL